MESMLLSKLFQWFKLRSMFGSLLFSFFYSKVQIFNSSFLWFNIYDNFEINSVYYFLWFSGPIFQFNILIWYREWLLISDGSIKCSKGEINFFSNGFVFFNIRELLWEKYLSKMLLVSIAAILLQNFELFKYSYNQVLMFTKF